MKASKLKFGVEIENFIPASLAMSGGTFEPGGYHRGKEINGLPVEKWNVQHDSSLCGGGGGYRGIEVVSPVLKGLKGLVETTYMVDTLKELGGHVTGACGLHVHVDGRAITERQIGQVKDAFKRWELAFYALSGLDARQRFNNTYCKPSHHWDGSRYCSLNLTNYYRYNRKKTIEVRVWAGSLDSFTVATAISMAVGLVSYATQSDTIRVDGGRINNVQDSVGDFCTHVWDGSKKHLIATDEEADSTDFIEELSLEAQDAEALNLLV